LKGAELCSLNYFFLMALAAAVLGLGAGFFLAAGSVRTAEDRFRMLQQIILIHTRRVKLISLVFLVKLVRRGSKCG
jgi:hypothetical protein